MSWRRMYKWRRRFKLAFSSRTQTWCAERCTLIRLSCCSLMWCRRAILDGWGGILFLKHGIYFYLHLFRTAAAIRNGWKIAALEHQLNQQLFGQPLQPLPAPPSPSQDAEGRISALEANVAEPRAQLLSRWDVEVVRSMLETTGSAHIQPSILHSVLFP